MDDSQKTDAELIRSILASNQNDYVVLMERYQQKIFAYLYRFLYQNREAAMDVTQDVFIKAYENLAAVDLNRPFQPWLYRIAHNEGANYLRSVSRKKESSLEDEQWRKMASADQRDEVEAEENRELVLNALDQLDPKYREVLVLFFFEEKSYKEIAQILDTSINTVGTLISRAKKQMEKALKKLSVIGNLATQILIQLFALFFITGTITATTGD